MSLSSSFYTNCPASPGDIAAVNSSSTKNYWSMASVHSSSIGDQLSDRNPPACTILNNFVFENFIFFHELFAKPCGYLQFV